MKSVSAYVRGKWCIITDLLAAGVLIPLSGCQDRAQDDATPGDIVRNETGVVASDNVTKPSEAEARLVTIPVGFRGRWAKDAAACAAQAHESELTILPAGLRYYESFGKVTRVVQESPQAIRITAHYSGEAMQWTAETRFTLDTQGQSLDSEGIRWVRCR